MDATPGFGQLLRRARRAAGLTQEALAERAGISARAVVDLERGVNRAPRRDTLELLADALDLTQEERARWERLRHRLSLRTTDPAASASSRVQQRSVPTNLPAEVDVLIGRDEERAAIGQLLKTRRLITLTGPGGIGKTRLAQAVGRDAVALFPEGVLLVELAAVDDVALVMPAIAHALAVREVPDQPMLNTVVARIGAGHLLLILDNLEHLATDALGIQELLAACPSLAILATSRVRLRLRGEQVVPLTALPTPDQLGSVTATMLADYGATALFLQRAREVKPDLVVTDASAPLVDAICRQLDGIPLAIELAAARCRVLSLVALRDRLNSALDVLSSGPRDLPLRHQTLRVTIAWSVDLLSPGERTLLRRLAVFMGGWTLEAAEAVAADLEIDVVDGLMSLVDHSLVTQVDQPDGSMRFRLLETIRAFAGEQLDTEGQAKFAQERHAAWYLDFAERHADLYGTAGSIRYSWLDQLAVEHDNLRHALRWYAEQSQPGPLLRLSTALVWFWSVRGHWSEGRHWLERALALACDSPPELQAVAHFGLGIFASEQGDWDVAASALEASLARFGAHGDQRGCIAVQNSQGIMAAQRGDRDTAIALFATTLEQAQALNFRRAVGDALNNLGVISVQVGDVDRAREFYEESRIQYREAELLDLENGVLFNLGWIALDQGRLADAQPFITDALAVARSFGDQALTVHALTALGTLALRQGNHLDAWTALTESLTLSRDLGYIESAATALEALAMLAVACQMATDGIRLFAAASTLRDTATLPNNPQDAARTEQAQDEARSIVGDAQFARAWSSGHNLSLDEAITVARGIVEHIDQGNV